MKRAAGIVTDRGGSTSHAAIVSRELGVPAVVGTGTATQCCATARRSPCPAPRARSGVIYDGLLDFDFEDIDLSAIPETRTEVMVNIADPAAAFQWWRLPARGVGLARMEFIINNADQGPPDGAAPSRAGLRRRPADSRTGRAAMRARPTISSRRWRAASGRLAAPVLSPIRRSSG
jgi:phosphoenolpyruvate synthase/pyruvate phosphate dikinase